MIGAHTMKKITDREVIAAAQKMQKCTDHNDHLSAYVVGCELFGEPMRNLKRVFQHIQAIQILEIGLDQHLSAFRYEKYCQLKKYASTHLTKEQFAVFYGAT